MHSLQWTSHEVTRFLLWIWWGYGLSWKFIQSGLEINTHTDVTQSPQAHTHTYSNPNLQREQEPALQNTPASHMWVTHMLGGLVNIPLMGEKTQDTVRGKMSQRQHNTWGEKKHLSFPPPNINTDECRCQQSCKGKQQWGSVMTGGWKRKTGWKASYKKGSQTKWHLWNSLLSKMHCLVFVSFLSPIKPSFLPRTPLFSIITVSMWILKEKNKN